MRIIFNGKMKRFEVYGTRSVVRNRELQPVFVSAEKAECEAYIKRVEART